MAEPAVLSEYSDRMGAEVVREVLEANGIAATVTSDDCGSLDPALQMVLGVRLLVPAEDLDRARELLAEIEKSTASERASDGDDGGDDEGTEPS